MVKPFPLQGILRSLLVTRAEVKEITANAVLGYNTGTFHVILKSGKSYNFALTSLDITDLRGWNESRRRAAADTRTTQGEKEKRHGRNLQGH
jgi:acyl dehydratase